MEWIIIIAVAIGIFYVVRQNKAKDNTEIPIKVSIDTGEIIQLGEETFCINPKSPLPLTLKSLSISDAKKIKRMLDGEAQRENNLGDITFLIAQKNIECVELNGFIAQAISEVSDYIKKQKQGSEEWSKFSEKDKVQLIRKFQMAAIRNLTTRPSNDLALEALLFGKPGDIKVDDQLLAVFSGNKDLYRFYLSNLAYNSKTNQVPTNEYQRKNLESLVELGLAKRGKEIPIEDLLNGLRVKDINEYFSDRIEKKFTRKAAAIEFATAQPDVIDVLSKHISFREIFRISEPTEIDIAAIRACYEYAGSQAVIIRDTYVTGYRTLNTLEDARGDNYDGWVIEAEDCCQQCLKLNGKKTKRKPSKLPPFHIGCTCSIDGIYD